MKMFNKLNLKNQKQLILLNAPQSFETHVAELQGVTVVRTLQKLKQIDFCLAFVTQCKQLDGLAKTIVQKAQGDALVWFAYPKGSSKKYESEISRDSGWGVLREAGFDSVRLVAVDEDWSALRFRRMEYIKNAARPQP